MNNRFHRDGHVQRAQYRTEQLGSFITQTRPPDQLVICDDRFTDDTPGDLSESAVRGIIFLSDQDDVWGTFSRPF